MYISNKDLEILKEIELYLYNINKDTITQLDNNFIAKAENVKDMYAMELYLRLYSINERLLQERKKTNKANWVRISSKRQTNKMYGRSKKEKEQHEKANKEKWGRWKMMYQKEFRQYSMEINRSTSKIIAELVNIKTNLININKLGYIDRRILNIDTTIKCVEIMLKGVISIKNKVIKNYIDF